MLFNSCYMLIYIYIYDLNRNDFLVAVQTELETWNRWIQMHRLRTEIYTSFTLYLSGSICLSCRAARCLNFSVRPKSKARWTWVEESKRCHPETSSKGKTQSRLQRHGTPSLVSYSLSFCLSVSLFFSLLLWMESNQTLKYRNKITDKNLYQNQHMHTCLTKSRYTRLSTGWWSAWGLSLFLKVKVLMISAV